MPKRSNGKQVKQRRDKIKSQYGTEPQMKEPEKKKKKEENQGVRYV